MTLRVLLNDEDRDRRALLLAALTAAGFDVVICAAARRGLLHEVRRVRPDLIIMDADSPERDTLESLCCVTGDAATPVVMFTHDDDADRMRAAIRAGVSAYIVGDVPGERIKAIVDVAVARFEHHKALQAELHLARTSLAERKSIERAKGILMRQRGCDEASAYQALRKLAMDRNQRLAAVAQNLIDAAELLG